MRYRPKNLLLRLGSASAAATLIGLMALSIAAPGLASGATMLSEPDCAVTARHVTIVTLSADDGFSRQ
jgi:anti-sigma factor RsiW